MAIVIVLTIRTLTPPASFIWEIKITGWSKQTEGINRLESVVFMPRSCNCCMLFSHMMRPGQRSGLNRSSLLVESRAFIRYRGEVGIKQWSWNITRGIDFTANGTQTCALGPSI